MCNNATIAQCLNCPHPDCINDKLDINDYRNDEVSEDIPKHVKKSSASHKRWADKNRERVRQYYRSYYEKNKVTLDKYHSDYARANKDRVAAAKRDRYHKNIEESRRKQREYMARKKAERLQEARE